VIVCLSGGTGGAKIVDGLALVVGQSHLTAIVNTGDDGEFYGLRVCPDLDICIYTLAGVIDHRGWGFASDTFRCLEGLATYGRDAWFGVGDRDLATHLHRTLMLRDGATLTAATGDICKRLGVTARVIPMSDDDVRTVIHTPTGAKAFQEYLVRDGAREAITGIELVGVAAAAPAPGVLAAIEAADIIVIAPSSPVVSIGTILAVPGVRDGLTKRRDRVVAISPIIGDGPVEGPADRFLAGIGETRCSAAVMARLYADVAATFLIHSSEPASTAAAVAACGVRPVQRDILMPDRGERARLAGDALEAVG
jgi:LPPG:FO 2-phospho-L-lactate transferase